MQWGKLSVYGATNITFPIPFHNAVKYTTAQEINFGDATAITTGVKDITKTGMTLVGVHAVNETLWGSWSSNWFAVGY